MNHRRPSFGRASAHVCTVILVAALTGPTGAAAAEPVVTPAAAGSWVEDFSDPAAFELHWHKYGFLASGVDAANPLGKAVSGADNTVIHPKDSPEAAELKKQGKWNRKFFYAKTEPAEIAPEEWHECVLELRGKELTVFMDGQQVLAYTTLAGDAPKTSIGLQPGGNGKTVLSTWFDDIRVEPIPPGQ